MVAVAIPTIGAAEEYYFNGVTLNDDVAMPFTDVLKVSGLDNAPVRQQTHDRDGTDGGYVDAKFETIRAVTIEGTIYTSVSGLDSYLDELKGAFAPSHHNEPLFWRRDDGQLRMVFAKCLGINYSKDSRRRLGIVDFQIQWLCEDPRIYTPTEITASVSLAAGATTGRGYNKAYNFGYGGAATLSALTVNVGGNREAPAVLRINGPVVNPSIIDDTHGTTYAFNITLGVGDFLDLDLQARSVMLNGTTNRRTQLSLTGVWALLEPGLNTFRFLGTQSPPTPVATLSIFTNSAWR